MKETPRSPEGQSLTDREAVRDVVASEHAMFLPDPVASMAREMTEPEGAQIAKPVRGGMRGFGAHRAGVLGAEGLLAL